MKNVKYVNCLNETFQLDQKNVFIQENDLYDYSWSTTSKNDRISGLKKGIHSKQIAVVIKGKSADECNQIANQMFGIMEKDVLSVRHGRLFVGDYYLKCYVTGSQKDEYVRATGYLRVTLKISTDFPHWIKETTETFNYGTGSAGTNLDFNRDFPSDYTSNLIGKQLNNTDFVPSNFRINIYGACENPKVTIGGHDYEIFASVEKNEYLTIDSVNKTIILTHTDGVRENCFNKRNKESYVFEKLPVGISNVSANGAFKFDVTLLEERSEPKWI